jgi:peptidoglycan/LPS O-acetylase OafA/YrhL
MEKEASARLYYLDWLRVLAILTVFVYHSSRFFNMEAWHVKNPPGIPGWRSGTGSRRPGCCP